MARLPRFVLAGHPQHVIIRSNNRKDIFYADEDYQFYLEKLKQACNKMLLTPPVNKWGIDVLKGGVPFNKFPFLSLPKAHH